MLKNNILITGTKSGLGNFLSKKLNCYKFSRKKNISNYQNKKWDLIIHTGFFRNGDNIDEVLNCLDVTYKISKLNSKKIIFISSMHIHDKKNLTLYKKAKQFCELFFDNKKKHYIIRLGSIVGNGMRKNTIYKILFDKNPKVSVSRKSKYSFVSYNEVLKLILNVIKQSKTRVINFDRQNPIRINKIAKHFKKKVIYGNFVFKSSNIKKYKKNQFLKIINDKSSLDILDEFKTKIQK